MEFVRGIARLALFPNTLAWERVLATVLLWIVHQRQAFRRPLLREDGQLITFAHCDRCWTRFRLLSIGYFFRRSGANLTLHRLLSARYLCCAG